MGPYTWCGVVVDLFWVDKCAVMVFCDCAPGGDGVDGTVG